MNRQETQTRELDAEVAEFVMGLRSPRNGTYIDDVCPFDGTVTTRPIPLYSSNISAAWEVVEKMELAVISNFEGGWYVGQPAWLSPSTLEIGNEIEASTAPLAICLAALKVVGRDISKYKELTK